MEQSQPILVDGATLDRFLSNGWYRMGQHIFTTDKIYYNDNYCPVFWIRYRMANYRKSIKQNRLISKGKMFTITLQDYAVTEELRELYVAYYNTLKFGASPSLDDILYYSEPDNNIRKVSYDSKLLSVRHNGKLIAAGIYDNGLHSIAGIVNFYLPDYKKYSLGKLLMLHKLEIAMQQKKEYYYPGYIVPGVPNFEYKTFVGEACIEVWDVMKKEWVDYPSFFSNSA
jgi:leucyl-tRNA---protein transferase